MTLYKYGMMRSYISLIESYLREAPLADISTHGDPLDQEGSFSAADRRYLTRAIEKGTYKRKLANLPFNLYVYVTNSKTLAAAASDYPEGELRDTKILDVMKGNSDAKNLLTAVRDVARTNAERDPDSIHLVLGDNFSDQQMPPTPWIIVHRLVHTLLTHGIPSDTIYKMKNLFSYEHCDMLDHLTMRSATSGNLDPTEAVVEITTQYLITGKVTFRNMEKLSPETREAIDDCCSRFKWRVDEVMKSCRQKVFYI